MFKRNKAVLLGAVACAAVWAILYYVLVAPQWSERETVSADARKQLDSWLKFYKPAEGTLAHTVANKELDREEQLLNDSLKQLKQIEFTPSLGEFTLSAASGGDPNLLFKKRRDEVLDEVLKKFGLRLLPGLDDLGFRDKLTDEPVALNLVRLFALRRLLFACKEAGVQEIIGLQYAKPLFLKPLGEEHTGLERLVQVPLIVRLKATERNYAQLLYEVQRPSDATRSYFCLRAFQVGVKDTASGLVDGALAVGALFPEKQLKALKVELKGEEDAGTPAAPAFSSRPGY